MSEIAEKIAREISDYVHGLSMGSQLATWDLKPVVAIIDRHLPAQPAAPVDAEQRARETVAGCRECGGLVYHRSDCSITARVLDSERIAAAATPPAPTDAQKLADAIVDCAVHIGITDGKQPLTGPQLLLLLDDVARGYEKGDEQDAEQRARLDKLITDFAIAVMESGRAEDAEPVRQARANIIAAALPTATCDDCAQPFASPSRYCFICYQSARELAAASRPLGEAESKE